MRWAVEGEDAGATPADEQRVVSDPSLMLVGVEETNPDTTKAKRAVQRVA